MNPFTLLFGLITLFILTSVILGGFADRTDNLKLHSWSIKLVLAGIALAFIGFLMSLFEKMG